MHKSRLGGLIIDCQGDDLPGAAAFWSRALGLDPMPVTDPADKNYVTLETPPNEVDIEVQRVAHESRVHIDIETDDIDAEVARLIDLGAQEVARIRGWVVMQAPTGQRFCVVKVQRANFAEEANIWP